MNKEEYSVGDIVYKTSFYTSKYPLVKETEGEILNVKMKMIQDEPLGAADKAFYRARYGFQETYPVFELLVKCGNNNFLVSQFGFNKDFHEKS